MSDSDINETRCFGSFTEYDNHIKACGGFDRHVSHRAPSLSNQVLPMFDERWVIGPDQYNQDVAAKMRPAFKLASRFLMERYPVAWFAHVAFGDRVTDRAGTYIRPNSFSASHAAIPEVREIIRTVGEVTTFMFEPSYEVRPEYGRTVRSIERVPHYVRHCNGHWPRVSRSARQGYGQPVIVMNRSWLTYFQRRAEPPDDEVYRVMFLFAMTLVHEFAHAFNFWLSPEHHEPRYAQSDNCRELGWSWENTVVGYGLQVYPRFSQDMEHQLLYQCKLHEYHTSHDRKEILRKLCGSNRTDGYFTCADAHGRIANPPCVTANQFRQFEFWFGEGARPLKYIAARQVVPMKWVTAWFSEEKWQERADLWRCRNIYIRPSLGNAFVNLYEYDGQTAKTFRPLNPSFPVDREILERRARGDYRL